MCLVSLVVPALVFYGDFVGNSCLLVFSFWGKEKITHSSSFYLLGALIVFCTFTAALFPTFRKKRENYIAEFRRVYLCEKALNSFSLPKEGRGRSGKKNRISKSKIRKQIIVPLQKKLICANNCFRIQCGAYCIFAFCKQIGIAYHY